MTDWPKQSRQSAQIIFYKFNDAQKKWYALLCTLVHDMYISKVPRREPCPPGVISSNDRTTAPETTSLRAATESGW